MYYLYQYYTLSGEKMQLFFPANHNFFPKVFAITAPIKYNERRKTINHSTKEGSPPYESNNKRTDGEKISPRI